MARLARLVAVVAVLGGCTHAGAAARPAPAHNSRPPGATTTTAPAASTTTTSIPTSGPAAVAARFTLAYFTVPPGGDPLARRWACRPYDTDRLDQLLALPSWAGADNTTIPGELSAVAIAAVNVVDTTVVTVDYEVDVTDTLTATTGQVLAVDQAGVELSLLAQPGGAWLVDHTSVST